MAILATNRRHHRRRHRCCCCYCRCCKTFCIYANVWQHIENEQINGNLFGLRQIKDSIISGHFVFRFGSKQHALACMSTSTVVCTVYTVHSVFQILFFQSFYSKHSGIQHSKYSIDHNNIPSLIPRFHQIIALSPKAWMLKGREEWWAGKKTKNIWMGAHNEHQTIKKVKEEMFYPHYIDC